MRWHFWRTPTLATARISFIIYVMQSLRLKLCSATSSRMWYTLRRNFKPCTRYSTRPLRRHVYSNALAVSQQLYAYIFLFAYAGIVGCECEPCAADNSFKMLSRYLLYATPAHCACNIECAQAGTQRVPCVLRIWFIFRIHRCNTTTQ